jgi:uncharacterized protein (UPF0147 family)
MEANGFAYEAQRIVSIVTDRNAPRKVRHVRADSRSTFFEHHDVTHLVLLKPDSDQPASGYYCANARPHVLNEFSGDGNESGLGRMLVLTVTAAR